VEKKREKKKEGGGGDFKKLKKIHFVSEIRRKPGNTVSFLSKSDVYYIISKANRGHIADVTNQQ